MENQAHPDIVGRDVKLAVSLRLDMQLPYGTVIAVLGFYPGEMKTLSSQRNLYIGIYCGFVCDSQTWKEPDVLPQVNG